MSLPPALYVMCGITVTSPHIVFESHGMHKKRGVTRGVITRGVHVYHIHYYHIWACIIDYGVTRGVITRGVSFILWPCHVDTFCVSSQPLLAAGRIHKGMQAHFFVNARAALCTKACLCNAVVDPFSVSATAGCMGSIMQVRKILKMTKRYYRTRHFYQP